MTGRIPFGFLAMLTVLVNLPIQAQDQMGPPPGYNLFNLHSDEAGQYRGVPNVYPPAAQGPRVPGPAPDMTYEQLPDDLGFGEGGDTPLGRLLTDTFRHAWFRGEYLQWTISKPGPQLLGEQTSDGVANPVTGMGGPSNLPISNGVVFTRTVNSIAGTAQSPNLDGLTIQNANGFRGTFGLPVPVGSFEFSGFVLAQNSSTFNGNDLIQPQIIANPAVTTGTTGQTGTPLGSNGLPATNGQIASFVSQAMLTNFVRTPFASTQFLDYDVSYQARMSTSAWGTEGNYYLDGIDANSVFQVKPSFGFRYFNLRDKLDQTGQYNQPSATDPTVTSVTTRQIHSSATNNLFGPQVGIRGELAFSRFVVGVEPKVMLGINSYQTNLGTMNILSSTDPSQSLLMNSSTFSPMVDLKGYTNVALSKNVSAYVAYNFLWAGNVTRSYNDIVYNVNTVTNQSEFAIKKELTNISLQGISMGFDIRY